MSLSPATLGLAKTAARTPSKYGHSDVGDVLVAVLKGETSEDDANALLRGLILDYRRGFAQAAK